MSPPLANLLVFDGSHTNLRSIMRRDPCPFCASPMVPATASAPTKEHLTPRSRGRSWGRSWDSGGENIVIACLSCNHRKANATLLEFLAAGGMRSGSTSQRIKYPTFSQKDVDLPSMDVALRLVQAAEAYFGEYMWRGSCRFARRALAWVAWQLELRPHGLIAAFRLRGLGISETDLAAMAMRFDRSLRGSRAHTTLQAWNPVLAEHGFSLPEVQRSLVPVRSQLRQPVLANPPTRASSPAITCWSQLPWITDPSTDADDGSR